MYVGLAVLPHAFLTSTLDEGEWTSSRHGRFTPGIHFIKGWTDPHSRYGGDEEEKNQ
jgi:hypothetical protein